MILPPGSFWSASIGMLAISFRRRINGPVSTAGAGQSGAGGLWPYVGR
ncbi:hypothetical protein [Xanthomonas oryzae]|nr:hypothetical protein [Xanthomonas oryzae]